MKHALALGLCLAATTLTATTATAATTVSVNTGVTNNWLVSPDGLSNNYATAYIPGEVHPNWSGGSSNPFVDGAKWITQFNPGTLNVPESEAYFQTVFDIGNIVGVAELALSGNFWVDNEVVEVLLNGNVINGAGGTFNGSGTAFGTTNAAFFVNGANTLTFRIKNYGPNLPEGTTGSNPAGLRVSGVFSAVPEPGTWMLMMLGIGAVGFSMRRRQKTQVRFQFA